MCEKKASYEIGKTSATCAEASTSGDMEPCKSCVGEELTAKKPFTLWRAKEA